MNAFDERVLLQRARALDQHALADIYDHYSTAVYRYAFRLLGDAQLAEDCTSETFNRFLTAIARGGGPLDYLQAYLFRVAHNWVVDHYRRASLTQTVTLEEDLVAHHDTQEQTDHLLEKSRLRGLVMRLPDEQRQVVILRYLEDWPIDQIARVMKKTQGAVKAMQHRAIASLKRLWNDQVEGSND
jgi:RNA polymerase sigma-70 factor (ECF subfamily)